MVDKKLSLDETSAAAQLIRDFDAMIWNLQERIEKERKAAIGKPARERQERAEAIQKMERKIRELEQRKVKIRKGKGSLSLHAAFLRLIRALFS